MPAVSVIVPVYKVEQYLAECIDSILAQTFTDFELILIDDGSPDNCGEICEEYKKKDNRIIVIHKENGGLSDARNKGIDIAKGEYLTFVDSDDLIHVDYLNTLFSLVKEYDADISMCSMEEFPDGSKCTLDTKNTIEDHPIVISGRDACFHLFIMDGLISVSAWGKLYASHLYKSLRFPYGRINEDQGTTPIAFYNAATVAVTSLKYYKYRNRENSIMHQEFNIKRFDDLYCTQLSIDYLKTKDDFELIDLANHYKQVIHAKLIIESSIAKNNAMVPKNYKMSNLHALFILRKYLNYQKYSWYLASLYPNWVIPSQYIRKIQTVIHDFVHNFNIS